MSTTAFARRLVIVAVCALALVITPFAVAGKKGSSKADPSVAVNPGGPYSFGEAIYVSANDPISASDTGPWIELMCYQNGVLVASGDHAGFQGGMEYNYPFNLGPTQVWSGGAADCTVTVFHQSGNRTVTDATTSFHVDG